MRAGTKGVIVASSFAALGLAAGCLASGSLEEAAASGCASDTDCLEGQRCADGACTEAAGGAGGAGGTPLELVDGTDECESSDSCLGATELDLVPDVFWVGGDARYPEVCTDSGNACAPGPACRLATTCAAPPPDATLPGLVRCETSEECLSGRCLESGSVRFCFRACSSGGDCPALGPASPTGPMFECGEVQLDGRRTVRTCRPAGDRGRTLCRNGEDCAGSGAGAASCRFVGAAWPLEAVPVCDAPPAEAVPTGLVCPGEDPARCEGGGCSDPCKPTGRPEGRFCQSGGQVAPPRCTAPCASDGDCPDRLACSLGTFEERVGSWRVPPHSDLPGQEGRDIRYCQLAREGCYDELDCSSDPTGDGSGLGWSREPRRCAVQLVQQGSRAKLLTSCLAPAAGTLPPGEACAEDAECDSNLCAEQRCTVPCDPDPARDRCADAAMLTRLPALAGTGCRELAATATRPPLRACLPR